MELKVDNYRTLVHFDSTEIADIQADAVIIDRTIVMTQDIHGIPVDTIDSKAKLLLTADETTKQWDSVSQILTLLLENGVARDGRLVGIGGGVLCDMAAFAASIYMRGIDCILMPTTLLAMVDAAFGGKTGINFGGYKNMVGTFHPARELIIQPDFLRSLPDEELLSGMGEVFKSALLQSGGLWDMLKRHGLELMQSDRGSDSQWKSVRSLWLQVIEQSLTIKGDIVAADFRETGQRAFLNLGHTYGHAAESVLGFGQMPHGTLVVWGILCALRLGEILGITPGDYRKEVQYLAEQLGFPVRISLPPGVSPEDLLIAMRADKKKRGGRVRFVLQRGLGETEQRVVEESLVLDSLQDGIQL
ncbi:MAG: 3-dehydroquinate synthase [Spirochaeta sp.]